MKTWKILMLSLLLSVAISFPAAAGPVAGTPIISSDVSSLDFGDEVAGQLSDPRTVTLSNTGDADLILADNEFIGAAPADFGLTMDFCSFQVLAPGESCDIEISMRPTELGDRFAVLVIESDDPNQDLLLINLSGRGTGSGGCAIATAALDSRGWWIFGLLLLAILSWRGVQRRSNLG